MSIHIEGFEWDADNVAHLEHAHPHISLELLEDIVRGAKQYAARRSDRYGKKVYAARQGKLLVLFNLKPGSIARIFSVHEVK